MDYVADKRFENVTVDCVVFGYDEEKIRVLLIRRLIPPFKGGWALPGGFVLENENLEDAAIRELEEETGVRDVFLEQLYTFGDVGRDPRRRIVSVSYYALVKLSDYKLQASTDAEDAKWFSLDELPELAFDHKDILKIAVDRLRSKVQYEPIGFELLPEEFALSQLQRLYEEVLGRELDKRNFRKKLLKQDILIDTGKMQEGVAHRAARLYSFDRAKYEELKRVGGHFEL
jgi:8-oxo-dGTP diphosphatase